MPKIGFLIIDSIDSFHIVNLKYLKSVNLSNINSGFILIEQIVFGVSIDQ